MNKNYTIPEKNIDNLYARVADLNRKARKLGVPEIILRKTGKITQTPIQNEAGETIGVRRAWEISVSGETPKFAGWSFSAVIESTAEGNILRKSPECTDDLTEYRDSKTGCDHCHTIRSRKETYVLTHNDGTRKQVGSTCIKDFLGHHDPHALAAWAEMIFSLGEIAEASENLDGDYNDREDPLFHTETFLAYVVMTIRMLGYVSGKRAKEDMTGRTISTRQDAIHFLTPSREDLAEYRRKGLSWPRPTDEDYAQGQRARQFVLESFRCKALTDFEHNLNVACKCEALSPKSLGIVAYVPEFLRRATETAKVAAESKHFGDAGIRYRNINLTFLRSTGFDTEFGYCFIYTFATESGDRLTWKTSSEEDFATGTVYSVTFTVKEHGEFRGQKQTMISRAKVQPPVTTQA